MFDALDDTIAAVATARQPAAVAVIRISGPGALAVAQSLLPAERDIPAPRTMQVVWLTDKLTGELLDQALVVVFPGPKSYTGQDMVELHCHGGLAVVDRVFQAVIASGARPAGPGEFTLRAFLGGKLDLSQAEAVRRLVEASSEAAARGALGNLAGGLGKRVRDLVEILRSVRVELEAELEFPDEDLLVNRRERMVAVRALEDGVRELLAESVAARLVYDGVRVALVGRANVGKSSLFNRLIGRSRAVVHHRAGTTRDYLSERVEFSGVLVELLDTAGERDSRDEVEEEAGRIAREAVAGADLLLLVVEGPAGPSSEDREMWNRWSGKDRLLVVNKADLGVVEAWRTWVGGEVVEVSAATGEGLSDLRKRVVAAVKDVGEEGLVVEERQRKALREAEDALGEVRRALDVGGMLDVAGTELARAERALVGVLGEGVGRDLLDEIFGQFCVGK